MKQLLIYSLLAISSLRVFGQDAEKGIKDKLSWGFSAHVTMSGANNSSTSNDLVRQGYPLTFKNYADSVQRNESMRLTLGGSLWLLYQMNKKIKLQTGLTYLDVGFTRTQDNIKFRDLLFPGIGPGYVSDNSQGSGTKRVEYQYRYQYLQIPLMINYHLHRSRDLSFNYYIGAGLAANVLVNHDIKAELFNFTADGESVFNIDSTGYEPSPVGLSMLVTAKVEYKYGKGILFFAQPVFGISPLSVSTSRISSYPYYVQLNAGFIYLLQREQ
ncbi:MAG: outer membrane beta-barrel protein [Bacteroidota bacterium]|jgi:hypothetical protein